MAHFHNAHSASGRFPALAARKYLLPRLGCDGEDCPRAHTEPDWAVAFENANLEETGVRTEVNWHGPSQLRISQESNRLRRQAVFGRRSVNNSNEVQPISSKHDLRSMLSHSHESKVATLVQLLMGLAMHRIQQLR